MLGINKIEFNDKADKAIREVKKQAKRFPNLTKEEFAVMVIKELENHLFKD